MEFCFVMFEFFYHHHHWCFCRPYVHIYSIFFSRSLSLSSCGAAFSVLVICVEIISRENVYQQTSIAYNFDVRRVKCITFFVELSRFFFFCSSLAFYIRHNMSMDELQRGLCHFYANWNFTTKISINQIMLLNVNECILDLKNFTTQMFNWLFVPRKNTKFKHRLLWISSIDAKTFLTLAKARFDFFSAFLLRIITRLYPEQAYTVSSYLIQPVFGTDIKYWHCHIVK